MLLLEGRLLHQSLPNYYVMLRHTLDSGCVYSAVYKVTHYHRCSGLEITNQLSLPWTTRYTCSFSIDRNLRLRPPPFSRLYCVDKISYPLYRHCNRKTWQTNMLAKDRNNRNSFYNLIFNLTLNLFHLTAKSATQFLKMLKKFSHGLSPIIIDDIHINLSVTGYCLC